MENLARLRVPMSWGEAEQAALDRCLQTPSRPDDRASSHLTRLSRTIETEIIPRLMLAHRGEEAGAGSEARRTISATEVKDFTRTVLEESTAATLDSAGAFRARGCTLEEVFLDLLAPTARLLGDLWVEDLCSFTDVTIGLSRLQQVIRELGPELDGDGRQFGRVLLCPTPGDQHTFGLSMLECFFRRSGWTAIGGAALTLDEMVGIAREEWLDVIGMSLAADTLFPQTASAISALRQASRNRSVFVMVGGRYFCDHPDSAADIGADAVARDAPEALELVRRRFGVADANG